jgi:arginine utilization regulatory protein
VYKILDEQVKELSEKLNKLSNENDFLIKSLNVLEEGIQIVDNQGNTIFYSRGLEKIEKSSSAQIIGKHISEAYKLDDESSILLKVLKSGITIKNHETTYTTSKGKTVSIMTNTYPICSNGTVVAAVSVNKDTSDKRAMSETIFKLQKQLYSHQGKNGTQYTFSDIIGECDALQRTIQVAKMSAVNHSPILIQGDTGTGKELFAQSIHNHSARSQGPFVAVNCAAIPETLLESILFGTSKGAFTGAEDKRGLFEEADNGTLFLDELSSMNMLLQSKLLRVLERKTVRRVGGNKEIPVDPRIISAVNIDPLETIEKDLLRRDLYYRLAVVSIPVPPLRERASDIQMLVQHFIGLTNKIMGKNISGISKEVLQLFYQHSWPGNIRELEHAIEYAMNVVESDATTIELQHLQLNLSRKSRGSLPDYRKYGEQDLKTVMLKVESDIIHTALEKNGGNISKTAKELGISRQHLQYRLKKLSH